jgi:hypothetical protein
LKPRRCGTKLGIDVAAPDEEPRKTFAIPAGTPHTFKVEGAGARSVTEFRPHYRIGEFFKELFALATEGRLDRRGNPRPTDLAVLMQRYPEDFFYLPVIPPGVQRAAGALPFGRVGVPVRAALSFECHARFVGARRSVGQ